jgi:hypothetical protein
MELFLDSCWRNFNRIDSEFGADDFAVMAVDAFVELGHNRWMVAFAVEFVGELKNVFGAEFDAVATPFASIVDDADHPFDNLYLLRIQRYSPKCHIAYL